MKKQLYFIQACPANEYFFWQTVVWLNSLRERNLSDRAIVLSLLPPNPKIHVVEAWQKLYNYFPESRILIYAENINPIIVEMSTYIPVIRPRLLSMFFRKENFFKKENTCFFYCDNDIIFLDGFEKDAEKMVEKINRNECFLSDTRSYIGYEYLSKKLDEARDLPMKNGFFEKLLNFSIGEGCKISEQTLKDNENSSGGAQYLFGPGVASSPEFWEKVGNSCLKIYSFLRSSNLILFSDRPYPQDAGFQAWTADMWAVLWNMWEENIETNIVPEMNFVHSTTPIIGVKYSRIMHNAGITGSEMKINGKTVKMFYKANYRDKLSVFDNNFDEVCNDIGNKSYCNYVYVKELVKVKEKYKDLWQSLNTL